MAEHTYRHPVTGVHTRIGKDDDLIAQGWERVDGPWWIVYRPTNVAVTKPIPATDADAAITMASHVNGYHLDTDGWYAEPVDDPTSA